MTKNLFKEHFIFFLSLTIFIIVFCVMGLPWINWWFNGSDDFNAIFSAYKIKTWKELFDAMLIGNTGYQTNPTNFIYSPSAPSFLCVYFRPLHVLFFTIEYWLFGINAYLYFLTNVFFHAINTVLLFNIFLWFTSSLPAFLSALLFAFHPQIAFRFGAVVNIQYYLNLTLILFAVILFKKFLDSGKWRYNIIAALLFFASLLIRETMIVLPAIALMAAYLYKKDLGRAFFATIPSGLAAFSYLAIRLILFPLKVSASPTHTTLYHSLTARIQELKVMLYDLLSLSWLPWGCKTFRAILLLSIFSALLFLFVKTKNKIAFICCLGASLLFFWPTILICYSPRYLYEALPFFLTAMIILLSGVILKKQRLSKLFFGGLTCYVIFLGFFVIENFQTRTTKMYTFSTALKQLTLKPEIKNRALCFLAYPFDGLGDHFASILWVMFDDPNIPIYFDSKSIITQIDSNLFKNKKWRLCAADYFDKNYLKITILENGFRLTSLDSKKIAFYPGEASFSIGKVVVNKTDFINGETMITDLTLTIDDNILQANPLCIWWDYEKQNFVVYDFKSQMLVN